MLADEFLQLTVLQILALIGDRTLRAAVGWWCGRRCAELRGTVAGRSCAEIAEELFISQKTVGVHVSNLLRKTGTANRVAVAAWARRHGLDVPGDSATS